MKPFSFSLWLWLVGFMVIGFPVKSTTHAQEVESEEAAVPVESEPLIELKREVHFLTPQGEDAVVSSGMYSVEPVEGGLRLTPRDEGEDRAVIIQAETTTHEVSVDSSQLISTAGEEGQPVVMLMLPNGTVVQAVGSFSGVRARGQKFKKGGFRFRGKKLFVKPRITGVLTLPKFGIIQEYKTVVLKGNNFGSSPGRLLLHGYFQKGTRRVASLHVDEWSSNKVKARVWEDAEMGHALKGPDWDQKVKLQVRTANGHTSNEWKMPFRAARSTKRINFRDYRVKVLLCSWGADGNICNGSTAIPDGLVGNASLPATVLGGCGLLSKPPDHKEYGLATIWARHKNCDQIVDWDEGSDRYEIKLRSGWVFKDIKLRRKLSSSKEWVRAPSEERLKKEVVGTAEWSPKIKWKISPNDYIEYAYWVEIEGPNGIPH